MTDAPLLNRPPPPMSVHAPYADLMATDTPDATPPRDPGSPAHTATASPTAAVSKLDVSDIYGMATPVSTSSPPADDLASNPACEPRDLTDTCALVVIRILGATLSEVKKEVLAQMLQFQGKPAESIPDIPIDRISAALYQMKQKKEDQRGDDEWDPAWAADTYTSMIAFMAVYKALVTVILTDLMADDVTAIPSQHLVDDFLRLFATTDNDILSSVDDPFTWFHAQHRAQLVYTLTMRIQKEQGIAFRSLALIDTVLTRFYTVYLLQSVAQQHQRNHGQFYTPQIMVQFMWARCFQDTHGIEPLQRVFDPCFGIGAFLCAYLTHLLHVVQQRDDLWNDGRALQSLFAQLPSYLWGIEIDPFAHRLGKLNIIVHLFPLYRRCVSLGVSFDQFVMDRLCLFRNDALLLALPDPQLHPWEHAQLLKLRDPSRLQFDYIVTNPPYMTRKTGFVVVPDRTIYDPHILGNKGNQAYTYFMWLCLQRLNPTSGQLCFITPTQWALLRFAEQIRKWMWEHCQLLEAHIFPNAKVWPGVQTDSLVFRVRKRQADKPCPPALFLRHRSDTIPLPALLETFARFDLQHAERDPDVLYKLTPTDDVKQITKVSMQGTFASLFPTSMVSDELERLTSHLPRLCNTPDAPLCWNRGPNTNPVYALVVRSAWARAHFGEKDFNAWLRPVFYWNGKKMEVGAADQPVVDAPETSANEGDKVMRFWRGRDPERMAKKECSPAEAYVAWPSACAYSMILIDKARAAQLDKTSPLYQYLRSARIQLQAQQTDKEVAWCSFSKCGVSRVKLIHPINFGYFSKSMPRQRFFLDRHGCCVTNQCMYLTLNPANDARRQAIFPFQPQDDKQKEDPDHLQEDAPYFFYIGLLNSSVMHYFTQKHCKYDIAGRMRFFSANIAKIPYAEPTPEQALDMVQLVRMQMAIRECIYDVLTHLPSAKQQMFLEKVRSYTWDLAPGMMHLVNEHVTLCDNTPTAYGGIEMTLRRGGGTPADRLVRLLIAQSLLQRVIEHLVYDLYRLPWDLRLALENEQKLTLTTQWQACHDTLQQHSPMQLAEAILDGSLVIDSIVMN